jgi:hypothetical protein
VALLFIDFMFGSQGQLNHSVPKDVQFYSGGSLIPLFTKYLLAPYMSSASIHDSKRNTIVLIFKEFYIPVGKSVHYRF